MLTWRDFVLRKHSLSPRLGRQKTEASFARDGHLHLLIDSGVVFFCAAFRFLGIFARIASGAVLSPVDRPWNNLERHKVNRWLLRR